MANYRAVAAHFPAVRDYLRNRRWAYRGDVLAYAPNLRADCFSTDRFGFRHSIFKGHAHGVEALDSGGRYGLVLGSSHVFGFGLENNGQTLPSRLAELLGFPCLNISFPEADCRTLHGAFLRIATQSPTRPALVVLLTGGDLTRYCYSGSADPLFGSPNFNAPRLPAGEQQDEGQAFANLIFFTRFWAKEIIELAARLEIPFCFGMDSTFFEKAAPDPVEVACGLGVPSGPEQAERFAIHRRRVYQYGDDRVALARQLRVPPPASLPIGNESYIDEFHFRPETLASMAEAIAEEVAPQLR